VVRAAASGITRDRLRPEDVMMAAAAEDREGEGAPERTLLVGGETVLVAG